jgi:multimeric flavodoxin WrbA
MKVAAFNGSGRKGGNTSLLIKEVFTELEKEGITCELIELAGKPLRGCTACMKCKEKKDGYCSLKDDGLNDYIDAMRDAEGIIIGSPVYFANVTAETKALIDRAGYVSRANGNFFKRKVGAAVVAVRRAGALNAFNGINDFFLIQEMIVPGSLYWNLGMGGPAGDAANDEEGIETMKRLGANMAWLLKRLKGLKGEAS